MPTKTITVDVDYDLDDDDLEDFTDKQLIEELKKRDLGGATPRLNSEEVHPLHEIYYALKFGLNEKAVELMRDYVSEELGVVL